MQAKLCLYVIHWLKPEFILRFCLFSILVLSVWACEVSDSDRQAVEPYEGPNMKTFDLVTNYSDSGRVKIRIESPLQLEYEDGNQEFPQGVTVNFFNAEEVNYSRLRANQAFFDKKKNEYTATGNVIVENLETQEVMKTEELHWTPTKREIYTDKFVVITTPREILKGNGLRAAQDFTTYKITKPTGVFALPEE